MNHVVNIFPVPLYIGEVRNKDSINQSLLNSKLIKENKLKQFENFTGNFNSSFGMHNQLEKNWIDELRDEIILGLKDYVKTLTKEGSPLPGSISLKEVWINSYKKGQYQEPHDHLGFDVFSLFSFIYYLKLPKESAGVTVFMNDGYGKLECFYSQHLNVVKAEVIPKAEEGRYIIFPSFLTHYVTHHSSDHEQRITIAGNFQLHYDNNPK